MAFATYDNSGSGTSVSFTNNGNILLCNTDNGTTSVTYGGQALTKIGGTSIFTWVITSPLTGANTLSTNGGAAYFISYTNANGYGSFTDTTYGPSGASVSSISTSQVSSKVVAFVQASGANGLTSSTGTVRLNAWNTRIVDEINAPTVAGYTETVQWSGSNSVVSYSNLVEVKSNLGFAFTGPASGNVNSASTNFTVTPDVAVTGTCTITPTGPGSAGLSPTVLTFTASAVAQTFTITPLTAGAITLTMTNGCGVANASPLTYTAIAVAPGAPTIGTAIPGNTNASVAFSAPASDGGATITNYTATSTPGTLTGTGASSPITVSGLTNGVAYTFKVKATNSAGTGPESSASNSVTPFVPATTFTFTGPSSGSCYLASTNFTVTPNAVYYGTITITPTGTGATGLNPTTLTFSSSSAQTFTITPLAAGSITLTPTNSGGLSNPSNLTYTSNAVVPQPPTMGLAIASQGSAFVTIGTPVNNGGSPITSYTVTSSPGGVTATSPTVGQITINGLTNGTSYTFTATATNAVGTSSASAASTPAVVPRASSIAFANSGPKFTTDRSVGNILNF